MNCIYTWLDDHDRPLAWLAKRVGMSPQTLGNRIRGLDDDQIRHTLSVADWERIMQITGLSCPICANQTTRRHTDDDTTTL